MNLVDVLMGGLVFSLASASSLQLYGSSLRWAQGHEQRQSTVMAMERAIAEGPHILKQQRDAALTDAPSMDCPSVASAFMSAMKDIAPPAGVSRELQLQGDLVSISVTAPAVPERRRWLSPAAYGLCGRSVR